MGWSSQILRRLLVGTPLPPSTGIGLIAGPGAYLPPPLDTYLDVGMVWINAGTMSYWGIRYNSDPSVLAYVAEFGFVTSGGVIQPQNFSFQNGPGVEQWFTGGSDIRFLNTGGVYFDGGTLTPVGFLSGNVQFYSDAYLTFNDAFFTKSLQIDPASALMLLADWDVEFDAASTLEVPGLRSSTSGAVTGDYSWTITSYGVTTSAGAFFESAVVFTAPPSGQVNLDYRGQALNSVATNQTHLAPEMRTGSTIGAGTVVLAAADANAMTGGATSANPGQTFTSSFCTVTGLVPGNVYNVRLVHRVNAGTGRTLLKELRVTPCP